MAFIYHEFYRRKCRILGLFRFSCTNFDEHLKSQSFKTASSGYVCKENGTILHISENLNQKVTGIKKI